MRRGAGPNVTGIRELSTDTTESEDVTRVDEERRDD